MSFSGRNNDKISNRPCGGGNKLQTLASTTNKRASSIRAIQNRAGGENRNLIFNINQLGSIGNRHNSQFATNAGGVSGPNIENPKDADDRGAGSPQPNTTPFTPADRTDLIAALTAWNTDKVRARAMYGEVNTWVCCAQQGIIYFDELLKDLTNFNEALTGWQTQNVVSMNFMFLRATAFNQQINFDTRNVSDMSEMFFNASSFNSPLIFSPDTTSVTTMADMFFGARAFNQPLDFNTSSVTYMNNMFNGATTFNQSLDFNTSKVTTMESMFQDAHDFNQNIDTSGGIWDVSRVQNMKNMFKNATAFKTQYTLKQLIAPGGWNLNPSIINELAMDSNYTGLAYNPPQFIPRTEKELHTALTAWNMNAMQGLLIYGPVGMWDVTSVISFSQLLSGLQNFNAHMTGWNTAGVTRMDAMFLLTKHFNQPIDFDTGIVTNMSFMFSGATRFNHPLDFNTSKVTNMESMFQDAPDFNQLLETEGSRWDVSQVINMANMFNGATAFNAQYTLNDLIDHGGWKLNKQIYKYLATDLNYTGLAYTPIT